MVSARKSTTSTLEMATGKTKEMKVSVFIATSLDGFTARTNCNIDWLIAAEYVIHRIDLTAISHFSSWQGIPLWWGVLFPHFGQLQNPPLPISCLRFFTKVDSLDLLISIATNKKTG